MQLPNAKTPIARCEHLSLYTQRMLQKFPNEAGLAGLDVSLGAATQALMGAQGAYRDAVKALIFIRVDVKFADFDGDRGLRTGYRVAEIADGGVKGRIVGHIYPNGSSPITRLVGQSQVEEMKNVEGRYASLTATWTDAASEGAKIAALRQQYEGALGARKDGMQTAANRRADRDVTREDFLDAFAKVGARVREVFPRDRKMQDMFFDTVTAAAGSSGGEDVDDDVPGDEATPVAP